MDSKSISLTLDDARQALEFCNSYDRARTLWALSWELPVPDWLTLLGDEWSVCDNLWRYRRQFLRILNMASPAELQLMMTTEEREAHARLPERFVAYRGCYPHNRNGLSYTLDKDIAQRFPTLNRYRQEGQDALLVTALTWRDKSVLKLDRNEQEVIAIRRRIVGATPLPRSVR